MGLKAKSCEHLNQLEITHKITDRVCAQCVEMGDSWVHLRMCAECGHIGCCNDSKNKHATKHFQSTSHPVIISAERGEKWAWCYADNIFQKL